MTHCHADHARWSSSSTTTATRGRATTPTRSPPSTPRTGSSTSTPPPRRSAGRDAIRDTFAGFLAQFPDLEFVEQESWIEDWGWVVRWKMSGTLAQPFDTGSGTAEPGGRMEIDALDVITVSDGRLTAKHTYVDWATALAQMGIA